jgi:hypothetical protein
MCYEERATIEHMWNGCSEMRERERKERGEIQNEDGKEIRWMKEICKRRKRIEKERGGDRKKKFNFRNCLFMFVMRIPKARRTNKALPIGRRKKKLIFTSTAR